MHQTITVKTKDKEYPVVIKRHLLNDLKAYVGDYQRVFIVSDTNVAPHYLEVVSAQCHKSESFIIEAGEAHKSYDTLEKLLEAMEAFSMKRSDLLIALGGGVVGDLAGFAASIYMRGIKYMMIPTTTLSQIDSSVGGKVAINFANTKNLVGNFYQPEAVLIDPEVLKTLSQRHYNAGLIEALKMGITSNKKLVSLFEEELDLDDIIYEAIKTKASIVEADEYDYGIRNILNFGHTIAHALEVKHQLIHGEAVLIGMLYECDNETVQKLLRELSKRFNINTDIPLSKDLLELIKNDKKITNDMINIVKIEDIGNGSIVSIPFREIEEMMNHE